MKTIILCAMALLLTSCAQSVTRHTWGNVLKSDEKFQRILERCPEVFYCFNKTPKTMMPEVRRIWNESVSETVEHMPDTVNTMTDKPYLKEFVVTFSVRLYKFYEDDFDYSYLPENQQKKCKTFERDVMRVYSK